MTDCILLNCNMENHCHRSWNTSQLAITFSTLQENLCAAQTCIIYLVCPELSVMLVTKKVLDKCIVNKWINERTTQRLLVEGVGWF